MTIQEVKRKIDGTTQAFDCETLTVVPGERAVLSYIWDRKEPYQDGPMYLPAQPIHTVAYYWQNKNYLVYKLSSAGNNLFGYRVDVCESVVISETQIHWQDLVLDFWIDPEHKLHVLDEAEYRKACADNLLNNNQIALVEKTKIEIGTLAFFSQLKR